MSPRSDSPPAAAEDTARAAAGNKAAQDTWPGAGKVTARVAGQDVVRAAASNGAGRGTASTAGGGWGERTLLGATTAGAVTSRPGRSTSPGSSARASASPTGPGPAARRPASGRARRVPFAVLLGGVVAAGMCGLLALNTATAASEVRERRVDAANASLSAKQEQLSRAVADIQAPAELARLAARLGLVPAGSPAFLRLNADGTVTVLGAPAKVAAPAIPLTAAQKAAARVAIANAAKAAAAAKAKASATTAPPTTAPTTTAPTSKAPTSKAPTSKAPTSKAPTTKAPTTKAPTTRAPATTAPATKPPKSKTPAVANLTVPGGPR